MWTNGWTDKRAKNGQTNGWNFTNFEKEPNYDGDLSPCQV